MKSYPKKKTIIEKDDYIIKKAVYSKNDIRYYCMWSRLAPRWVIIGSIVEDIKKLGITISDIVGFWNEQDLNYFREFGCVVEFVNKFSDGYPHEVTNIKKDTRTIFERNQLF